MNDGNFSEMENLPQDQEQETEAEAPETTLEENLNNKIEELEKKANEYLDGWQRSRAEFANYKRRIEREQAQAYQAAAGNIIKKFLEVADDLERALKNRPQEGKAAEWANGIELIYRKLLAIMEAEGVKVMDVSGQIFDPSFHEAISHEEADGYSEGEIIEVVKKGYVLGDRVLRPALVRVAR